MIEYNEQDEVIQLLRKLKTLDVGYPPSLLATRRQDFLKNAAGLGTGAGVLLALWHFLKGSGPSLMAAGPMAKLVEAVLVVAIATEAGAVAYINRGKLPHLVRVPSTKVQEIGTAPAMIHPLTEISVTNTVAFTETVTPSSTASPPLLTSSENSNAEVSSTTTPMGNNGNQYGLTPKPERTKQPEKPPSKPKKNP